MLSSRWKPCRVSDSSGHTAKAVRTVHVVESMETMQGGVPILMYHYVYDPANPPADLNGNFIASTAFEQQLSYLKENDFYFPSYPEVKAFIEGKHSLPAKPADLNGNFIASTAFEQQLSYLKENDFYFPSYPEVKAFIEGKHSLPAKSVVLTFDDGEMGFLNVGVPLLEKHQVPATSFVIASDADAAQKVIDHRSPYVAFESHSFGMHKPGGNVGHGGIISAMSRDEIAADLKHAQEIVGGTQAFAYPFGDVTDDGRAAVRDAGILCAFTTQNSWAHVGDDVTALPRGRDPGLRLSLWRRHRRRPCGCARRRHPLRLHHAKLVGACGRRRHRPPARAHLRRVFARFVYRPGERIGRAGGSQQK